MARSRRSKDCSLILRAAQFAAERHRHQWRKGRPPTPFINHPIEVARVLCEEGGETHPQILAAALLHDTIEDTPTVFDDLEREFGRRVANLVAEVTDDKRLPKQVRKRAQVRYASKLSRAARQIKLADKICNLREILANPPADWSRARKQQYFDWALKVVNRIRSANPRLAERFDAAYALGAGI